MTKEVSDEKIICVCCDNEGIISLDLKNMQWKGFVICPSCLLIVQRLYKHGECDGAISIDEIPEEMLISFTFKEKSES